MEHSSSELTIPSFTHQPQHSSTPIKKVVQQASSHVSFSPNAKDMVPPSLGHATRDQMDKLRYQMAPPPQHLEQTSFNHADVTFPQNLSSLLGEETIQKQRHELQLLMGELRDRDRELNSMVATHQQQLAAWESDRHRILRLEQKAAKLQGLLQRKTQEAAMLQTRLGVLESEQNHKMAALENTQQQLVNMSEQQSQAALHLKEMEEKNRDLNDSVKDMINAVEHLEAKEHQLEEVIKAKDSDLLNTSHRIEEMTQQVQQLDAQCSQLQEAKDEAARKEEEWRQRCQEKGVELEKVQEQLSSSQMELDKSSLEVEKYQKRITGLQAQLHMAEEREKRKDEVIHLQRSKQERLEAELDSLRQLYERQQRDLSLLHLNLESSKEMLERHSAIYSDTSSTYSSSPVKSQTSVSSQSSPSKASGFQYISPIQKHHSPMNVKGEDNFTQRSTASGDSDEEFHPMQPDDGDSDSPTYTRQVDKLRSQSEFVEPPPAKAKHAQGMRPSMASKRSVKNRQGTPRKVNQKARTVEVLAADHRNVKGARHKSAPFVGVGDGKKQPKQPGMKSDFVYHSKNTNIVLDSNTTVAPSREQSENQGPSSREASGKNSHRSPQTAVQVYTNNEQDDSLSELTQNMSKAGLAVQKPAQGGSNTLQPEVMKMDSTSITSRQLRSVNETSWKQVHDSASGYIRYDKDITSNGSLTNNNQQVPEIHTRWRADQHENVQSCPELSEFQKQLHSSHNQRSSHPTTLQTDAHLKPGEFSSEIKDQRYTDSDGTCNESSKKSQEPCPEAGTSEHIRHRAEVEEGYTRLEENMSHDNTHLRTTATNRLQWAADKDRSTTPLVQQANLQNVEPSPLGKLEQLLAESRQMVAQLEHNSTKPYFTSVDKGLKDTTPR